MSFMVVSNFEPLGNSEKPFGNFGPFPTREEAEKFVRESHNPDGYTVYPSDWCR